MDQRIIDLYDNFTHGGMSRREFLDRLAGIAGSQRRGAGAVAAVAERLCERGDRCAATMRGSPSTRSSYDAGGKRINGYLARLKAKGKRPAVIVIHENRGLNPHIEDVARRLALEGFLALPPTCCRRSAARRPTRTRRAR